MSSSSDIIECGAIIWAGIGEGPEGVAQIGEEGFRVVSCGKRKKSSSKETKLVGENRE